MKLKYVLAIVLVLVFSLQSLYELTVECLQSNDFQHSKKMYSKNLLTDFFKKERMDQFILEYF